MIPQPGKVSIQVKPISLTTERLIAENLLTAPTPIIAVVFACVVEWTVTKEATKTETGIKTGKCTVCGESIIAETGKLVPSVDKSKLEGNVKASVEAIGDTKLYENVIFKADNITEAINSDDKSDIEKKANGLKIGASDLKLAAVFVDGTHIKANANIKKVVKKAVPQAAKIYEKQLMEEINEDRESHNKKPFDGTKEPEEKVINESTTDPESGVFHKGEHKKCLAYTAQTGCDKNGYVMDVTVNPGNVHDSIAFDELYDRLVEKNPEIETVVADAGYKTPWISKKF